MAKSTPPPRDTMIPCWIEIGLAETEPILALRENIREQLAKGARREVLNDHLANAVQQFRDRELEHEEDILLDIMDFLAGWCIPHMKLGQ